jgi:gluconate 5-dehydrogenase
MLMGRKNMANPLFDLSGRVALVTGSSQGIGLGIARGLAQSGARVVLNGRNLEKLLAAQTILRGEGLSVDMQAFDVTVKAAVTAAVDQIEREIGPIDILVNNAGIQRRAPFVEFSEETWHEIIASNIDGVFFPAQAVAARMIARQRGKIINICSVMSELGRPNIVPYTATKGAVKMMTKGMCAELGKYNIQVNGIGPGYIKTELNQALLDDEKFFNWVCTRTPAGRWADIDELAGAAIFLASDASNYVNGQILMVDGGMTAAV